MYTMCKTYGITKKRRGVGDRDRWVTRGPGSWKSFLICWTTCHWERPDLNPNSSQHRSEIQHPKTPHGAAQIWSALTLHYSVVKALRWGGQKQGSRLDLTCSTVHEGRAAVIAFTCPRGPDNHRAKSHLSVALLQPTAWWIKYQPKIYTLTSWTVWHEHRKSYTKRIHKKR